MTGTRSAAAQRRAARSSSTAHLEPARQWAITWASPSPRSQCSISAAIPMSVTWYHAAPVKRACHHRILLLPGPNLVDHGVGNEDPLFDVAPEGTADEYESAPWNPLIFPIVVISGTRTKNNRARSFSPAPLIFSRHEATSRPE